MSWLDEKGALHEFCEIGRGYKALQRSGRLHHGTHDQLDGTEMEERNRRVDPIKPSGAGRRSPRPGRLAVRAVLHLLFTQPSKIILPATSFRFVWRASSNLSVFYPHGSPSEGRSAARRREDLVAAPLAGHSKSSFPKFMREPKSINGSYGRYLTRRLSSYSSASLRNPAESRCCASGAIDML
jgi:hypothetical protein